MKPDYITPLRMVTWAYAVCAAALLTLAACGTTSTQAKLATGLADACNSFANDIDQLTPLKAAGKLKPATLSAVDTAISLTSPLCAPGTVPNDFSSATTFVLGEAAAIYAIYQENK